MRRGALVDSPDFRTLGDMATTSPPHDDPARPGRVYGKARVRRPVEPDEPGHSRGTVSGRARVPAGGGRVPVSPSVRIGGRPPGPPRRIRPRWGRIALVAGALLTVLGLIAGLGGCLYVRKLNDDLARIDPFSAITGDRPTKTVQGSLNILLLGSDSRDPDQPKGDAGPARTDTIIVMHIPAAHDRAYLVSIPRDLYVYVPKSPDGQFGDRRAKINAAYAWGGVPLMVQTVEGYTGLRMDHVVVIDFFGFKDVTDALGGVDMNVEQDITSIHPPYRQFKKGMNHFNGEEALDYVRQRYQFPDGDFARMRHQQEFLTALLDKAVSTGTVTNPVKLNAFLKAATKAITVDQDFSLVDMALQFRGLRSDDLTFLTAPHSGTDMIDGESVVVSDRERAAAMFDAMAKDTMAEWMAANPKPTR